MILSANLLTLLCRQYAHEVTNSLVYASFQSWADMRGLDGTAAFFASQAKGERDHADMVLKYIHDRSEQLAVMPIDVSGAVAPSSFVGLFLAAQELERGTSDAIAEIRAQAEVERDMMTCAWLVQPSGLVMEQIEEEATIQTILDRITARRGLVPLNGELEADMAEMPGEIIHDIDCWIKARA